MAKPRILILSTEFPPGPGGIGMHCFQIAKNLSLLGWDVLVLTLQDYAPDEEVLRFNRSQSFQIVRLDRIGSSLREAMYRYRVASRHIREFRPNLLLASGSRAVWIAALLASRNSVPWIAVGHGSEFGTTSSWQRMLTGWSFRKATVVICVSQYTRERMRIAGIEGRKVFVIPNGADRELFRLLPEVERKNFKRDLEINGAFILATVGNITERKGQDVIVRALPLILNEVPNVQYLMAGLPTNRDQLTRLATDLGVADRLHFLGRVDDHRLVQLLNSCDLFCLTSRNSSSGDFEGYGIAVVEAALCGKPAIVSSDSGLTEAILEGSTGYAVPQNDEKSAAQKIISLLQDEKLRQTMGDQARERALQEQTWELRAREYDAVLRQIVDR